LLARIDLKWTGTVTGVAGAIIIAAGWHTETHACSLSYVPICKTTP
jgi:hypothetical protein